MTSLADHRVVRLAFMVPILWLSSGAWAVEFAGGTGEPNDPYRIATTEQLISIGSDPNLLDKHFVLLNDIDLDPNLPGGRIFTQPVIAPNTKWGPNGMEDVFTGSFDGRAHKIRNLIIHSTARYVALFGCVGEEGVVRDLAIDQARVAGHESLFCAYGALVAENRGRLVRCTAEAHVYGSAWVGVLVGQNIGEIVDCWSAGEATGEQAVGGLVGVNWPGVILRSHASSKVLNADVWSGDEQFGGLVGWNEGGLILDCYATGAVSGRWASDLGGLVGENTGMIMNSYATGDVSGEVYTSPLGGLVGYAKGGIIYDCYTTGDVNGISGSIGGLVGRAEGARVANSYSTGRAFAIANRTAVGGLVGSSSFATISGCFWDTETSGVSRSIGGVGLTTAQMQNVSTFIEASWDWVDERANGTADLWFIPEGGGYPLLTAHSATCQPRELEGSGTADDPYRIGTAEDLGAISHYDLEACYRLEADISLAGITWCKAPIQYFEGRLDGAGKVVTGLKIEGLSHLGLFGHLGRQASVENLGLRDARITGANFLGMLAGENRGRIMTCCASGSVAGAAGLGVGGLAGWNEGSISESYAIGRVMSGHDQNTGGLTGGNVNSVRRCYAAVYVTSLKPSIPWFENVTGGLVGSNELLGMVVGKVDDSYFLIQADGGGPHNGLGIALTGIQMKQQASFAGWDFDQTWMICEDKDYPHLQWENVECEE